MESKFKNVKSNYKYHPVLKKKRKQKHVEILNLLVWGPESGIFHVKHELIFLAITSIYSYYASPLPRNITKRQYAKLIPL
jgi:hypothetical protein